MDHKLATAGVAASNGTWFCQAGPFALPFNIIDAPYCDAGYLCPNIIPGANYTYPQICPPTIDCQIDRLGSGFCQPQGVYEPELCLPGHFCSNFTSMQPCPAGTFCIRGSAQPVDCPFLSICPAQSHKKLELLGIAIAATFDVLLLALCAWQWFGRRRPGRRAASYTAVEKLVPVADAESSTSVHLLASDAGATATPAAGQVRSAATGALEAGFRRCNPQARFGLEYEDVCYDLPGSPPRRILQHVSGRIRSGRVTGIMGPSGAGKTTFMGVLMGKLRRSGGVVRVNGREEASLASYRACIGYVPQDDVMLPELTVRENILFSARVRLPRTWSDAETQAYVDALIQVLGLTECANTRVGDVTQRGISGGQRKRVNIGIELAAAPACCFLDEPTSGLDASAALEVAGVLRTIANLGITVIAVIHQPRREIFECIDDLVLLRPGGHPAYVGPREGCTPHFEAQGYLHPVGVNSADWIMDVLAGVHTAEASPPPWVTGAPGGSQVSLLHTSGSVAGTAAMAGSGRGEGTASKPLLPAQRRSTATSASLNDGASEPLLRATDEKGAAAVAIAAAAGGALVLADTAGADGTSGAGSLQQADRQGASFLRQVFLCHQRSLLQQWRQYSTYGLEMGVALLAGTMMGAASSQLSSLYLGILKPPYTLLSPAPMEVMLPSIGFYVAMAVGLAGSPAGVLTFGEERLIFLREAAAGHNILAYYLGKSLSVFYRLSLAAVHFTGVFMLLARPTSSFGEVLLIVWVQFLAVYGQAACISMLVKREQAALLAVIASLILGTLCGYGPTLTQFDDWHLSWLLDLSYSRWAVEAWFDAETRAYRGLYMVAEVSAPSFGYTLDRFGTDMVAVVAIAVGYRLIAYPMLLYINSARHRQG